MLTYSVLIFLKFPHFLYCLLFLFYLFKNSFFFLSYPILSYPILSYLILSHPISSYLILSHPVLSCPTLTYPTLSYPIPSYINMFETSNIFINVGTHTIKYIDDETVDQCLLDNSHEWKWLDEDAQEVLIKKKVRNITLFFFLSLCCSCMFLL